jgi:hypothetical protein
LLAILGILSCSDTNQPKDDEKKIAQDEKEKDTNRNDIKPKIKWCLQSVYQAKKRSAEIEKGERINHAGIEYNKLVKYDSLGNETDFIEYTSEGTVYSKFNSKYDNKGNIMEREATRIEGKDIAFKQKTYEYDENNHLKEFKWYQSNGDLGHKKIYKYDDNGNVITSYFYNYYGSLVHRKTYKYDENSNLIDCSAYKINGLSFRLIYKYDENNNEIEHRELDKEGNVTHKNTRIYDDNHNVIEHMKYYSETDTVATFTYKYIYDKQGNFVEKVCFKNSTPEFIIERSYHYYN